MPIYLDYNATAPLRNTVKKKIIELIGPPANSSSIHFFGRNTKKIIDESRSMISLLINCQEDNVVFTSGGTESNSTVLQCFSKPLISSIEHDAVIKSCKNPIFIDVNENGKVNLNDFEKKIKQHNPDIVSVMWANNETGVIQPIEEVVSISKAYKIPVHCDAVQVVGKIPINFKESGLYSLAISAHKMGGPTGIGALILSENSKIKPLIYGGGQEKGRRSGTENFLGIVGFGYAAIECKTEMDETKNYLLDKDKFETKLLKKVKNAKIICYNQKRLPNTSAIFHPLLPAETQVIKLDLMGFSVSAGAACSSGKINKSYVLKAMGLDWALNNTIRVSNGWQNVNNDLDKFIEAYKNITK